LPRQLCSCAGWCLSGVAHLHSIEVRQHALQKRLGVIANGVIVCCRKLPAQSELEVSYHSSPSCLTGVQLAFSSSDSLRRSGEAGINQFSAASTLWTGWQGPSRDIGMMFGAALRYWARLPMALPVACANIRHPGVGPSGDLSAAGRLAYADRHAAPPVLADGHNTDRWRTLSSNSS
jgi:hypothetical protein